MNKLKPLFTSLILLLSILVLGTIGFIFIEKYPLTDALFMTVNTVATVGLNEFEPLTNIGKWFTIILILFSFGTFAYALTSLTSFLADGSFTGYFKTRMIQKRIDSLKDHVIVCGFGNNGKQVVLELRDHHIDYVIIDKDPDVITELSENSDDLYLEGDSTQDDVLMTAGIKSAKALIATLPDDSTNVFLTLTARELNPNITIISRASENGSDIKLKRAGANNVIMPDKIGGRRMARLIAQPDVVHFIENVMDIGSDNVIIDEVTCYSMADYFNGRSLRELQKYNDSGVQVLGLKQADRVFVINPLSETTLSRRDKLFVLGTRRQIENFKKLLQDYSINEIG